VLFIVLLYVYLLPHLDTCRTSPASFKVLSIEIVLACRKPAVLGFQTWLINYIKYQDVPMGLVTFAWCMHALWSIFKVYSRKFLNQAMHFVDQKFFYPSTLIPFWLWGVLNTLHFFNIYIYRPTTMYLVKSSVARDLV